MFGTATLVSGKTFKTLALNAYSGQGGPALPSIPSVQAGDLLIAVEIGEYATTITPSMPSGWEQIAADTGNGTAHDMVVAAKVATGSETGTLNFSSGSDVYAQGYAAFRANLPIASITVQDANIECTNGNPSSQVKNATSFAKPMLVFGVYFATGTVNPRTFTGMTADGEQDIVGTPDCYIKHLLIPKSATASDITIDMDDEGINGLASAILELSA